jgi:hypothetical protein
MSFLNLSKMLDGNLESKIVEEMLGSKRWFLSIQELAVSGD